MFQSVENKDWFRHLTNWAWVWHVISAFLLLYEYWDTNTRLIRDGVLNIGANVAAMIIGGMIVLYVQDRSVLEEAEDQYGRTVMELGNFVLHFAPLILYWGFHAMHKHMPSLYTRLCEAKDARFILFASLHFLFALIFALSYGALFKAHVEYGAKLDVVSMGVGMFSCAFLNHVLFVETIGVKSRK